MASVFIALAALAIAKRTVEIDDMPLPSATLTSPSFWQRVSKRYPKPSGLWLQMRVR